MFGVKRKLGAFAFVVAGVVACGADKSAEHERPQRSRAALTTSIPASADTFLRKGAPNTASGTLSYLRLQASGDNRALVRFPTEAVSALGTGPVTLTLPISFTANNWGPTGRAISLHRMLVGWDENATWNCTSDLTPSNSSPDCPGGAWEMDTKASQPELNPWVATPTATAIVTSSMTGAITFTVTSDVELFRSGAAANFGWLVKKVEEGEAGRVELASRETATPPLLTGSCDDANGDGVCDPPSDGGGGGGGDAATDSGAAPDAAADAASDAAADAAPDASPCGASCDDGLPCTLDTCTALGCVHEPAPAGTACSDGNACTTGDACDATGACVPGTPVPVSDGLECTRDRCDPLLGVIHEPEPDGTGCVLDADPCNGTERCIAGVCQLGTPPNLSDGDPCTVDACTAATGITHTPIPGCNPTPVATDAPYESRASLLGRVVSSSGEGITNATFTVYDERALGAPRGDATVTTAPNGAFKIRLTTFPESEPERSPPHRLVVVIDSPSTLRAYRTAYAHPGDSVDLGTIRLVARDPRVTNIGPAGGTATDSQGLVEIVIPPGALATTLPIQITPFATREDFPAPLPDNSITMYGFEAEPSGTHFAVPVTVRAANYRNLPTSLAIPIGSYDPVEGRWDHDGVATWDGTRFAGPLEHFSEVDLNANGEGDLLLLIAANANPNKSRGVCGAGSAWQIGGGSISQAFPLPGTRARSDELSFSLHYDSGLAGTRKMAPPSGDVPPTVQGPNTTMGSLAVSIPGVTVQSVCVSRGAGAGGATQPGQCVVSAGGCGQGGVSIDGTVSMLASDLKRLVTTAPNATESAFGGWVNLPLDQDGQLPSSGFVTQTVSIATHTSTGSACAGSGGSFGVSDPLTTRVQISGETGAELRATRKVLLHHRFTSPFGAGWAIREVSRLYSQGDMAVLVHGDGQEEDFRPRARVSALPDNLGEHVFARDPETGEIFVASFPGTISRVDVASGARTPLLTGLGFPSEFHNALAVAYVGGVRHFVVAFATKVVDIDATGAQRQIASRGFIEAGHTSYGQAALAARGDKVFYTAGDLATPVLYRIDLSSPSPSPVAMSSANGIKRLHPQAPLSTVELGHPLGLAFGPDGTLYVADARRNAVYRVLPDATGAITGASTVLVAMGDGNGRQMTRPGEAQPANAYAINQPLRLSMAEDGRLLVMNGTGIHSFDPVAREAELLFLDRGLDEITPSLAGLSGFIPAGPASFVAVTRSLLFSRTLAEGLVRVDVDLLSSETDPTRTIARTAGGHELTDTTSGMVWRFEQNGRLVEQKRRTGETDFSVTYTSARGDAIDRITNATGGQWAFSYANGKLASITDPAGGQTAVTVNGQGDLAGFVEPDGEAHAFSYDQHHMASKTTSRGDVTSYTFAPNGTVATSTKPGGETYSFETVPAVPSSWDASGRLERMGAYTDGRGVRHEVKLDSFGAVERELTVADGVTRAVEAVVPATLLAAGEPGAAARKNVFRRASHQTVNGLPLAAPITFDSLGRPVRQQRIAGGSIDDMHRWAYAPDGWLKETFDGPSSVAQRIDRDPLGRVTKIADVVVATGGTPTGRETSFTWRSDGQLATMTSHGVTTTFSYDDAGGTRNLVGTSDTLGRTLALTYDARGNVATTSDGTASSAFFFDANNRLLESRDGAGNATLLRYTHAGCGCSESDLVTGVHTPDLPAGVEWTMAYGPQGRVASVTDPHGFTESYTYEPTGEVRTVQDRLARTTTMAHDQLGRLLSIVDTLGRKHQRSYSVPTASGWAGPSLAAASADATSATTSLSGALRSGDYQIGVDAHDVEGFPAQIAFYRDATFALGYTSYFDKAGRPSYRADRTSRPIDSADVPASGDPGAVHQERFSYDGRTSAPVLESMESPRVGGFDVTSFQRDVELDASRVDGFSGGVDKAARYDFTRDAGGRVTSHTNLFSTLGLASDPTAPLLAFESLPTTYSYYPDGRIATVTGADGSQVTTTTTFATGSVTTSLTPGSRAFTYDSRGLVATQTAFDGVYRYFYDEVGRNTRLELPDGHARVQVFDDLGRIVSRCYRYANPADDRCYGAQYDPVGNPTRLSDPEGTDDYEYDALDRLKKATRKDLGGAVVSVEDYTYNALGALSVHAGVAVDHQRPRLAGGGSADAAVPATHGGLPVGLDLGGRVTSLVGLGFDWSWTGQLRRVNLPVPSAPVHFGFDPMMRRAWTLGTAGVTGRSEFYLYEGANRVAAISLYPEAPRGEADFTVLYDGIDHPLRAASASQVTVRTPPSPLPQTGTYTEVKPSASIFYELDLAGNVRRLRGHGGLDLGGYRYSAFGRTLENTVGPFPPGVGGQMSPVSQPLRWKGMWRFDVGGVELYDARARMWSPELGVFVSVDEYAFHDPATTLWGWPHASPLRYGDPFGRGVTPPGGRWDIGVFAPGTDRQVLEQSAQWNVESGRAWDAGDYGSAALKLWASAGAFYAAKVTVPLLTKRPVTSADMAMMACPIEAGGIPAEWKVAPTGGPPMVPVEQAARMQRQALFERLMASGSFEQGRHGQIRSRVGAELVRMSNDPGNLPEYNAWLRRLGNEELQRAGGVNHR